MIYDIDNKDVNFFYDVIVIGAGHAGCEAALAAARLNNKTLCLATNLDTVAFLACNPSIGGTAKGQIVKEIDALGGEMAVNTDKSLLQLRMLNRSKGPAVYSPRAQVDKNLYHANMKHTLETTPNLFLRQGEAVSILPLDSDSTAKVQNADNAQTDTNNGVGDLNNDSLIQNKDNYNFCVGLANGLCFYTKSVVVATGVYLNSRIVVGSFTQNCGPNGFASAQKLSNCLSNLGYKIMRFKTGTPARVNSRSIDYSKTQLQCGELYMPPFSFLNDYKNAKQFPCYLTYTTQETKQIILQNKQKAPIFSGEINGVGPRYCPSIEDKVVRFADKERHQIFLEPEGADTEEVYVQGVSSSMPADIQYKIYRTIDGLQNVEIMRDAYAIEYDCIDATALFPTLMSKTHNGLFFAGQINGTSGYEEAGGQGLVAGINASRFVNGQQQIVLGRMDAYIGVLIDDLTTKGTNEPYRMMTGRAEYRLVLRQDNADIRLTELGRKIGLVSDKRYEVFLNKTQDLKQAQKLLNTVLKPTQINPLLVKKGEAEVTSGVTVGAILKRAKITVDDIERELGLFKEYSLQVKEQIEIEAKYEGYIKKEQLSIAAAAKTESKQLSSQIDYSKIEGLRIEARQKLNKIKPMTLGQASRISGVSPADIAVLTVYLASDTTR